MREWPSGTARYLLIGHVAIPLLINIVINLLIGWIIFSEQKRVPIWGSEQSVMMELIGTNFLLPLITSLIAARWVAHDLRVGNVQAIEGKSIPNVNLGEKKSRTMATALGNWVAKTIRGGNLNGCVLFAFVLSLVFTIPILLVLRLSTIESIDKPTLVIAKGIYGGAYGLIVSPLIAISLLRYSDR